MMWYYWFLNLLDVRWWGCDCTYTGEGLMKVGCSTHGNLETWG